MGMDIRMELTRILITETSDAQVIVLKETDGERQFPIGIGFFEAAAIDRRLKHIPIPRPMTHELLCHVITELGGRLDRIVLCDLDDGTFYAKLVVAVDGRELEIDSRPSDAIALAVADDTPIFCSEHVIELATMPPKPLM
jgi:uncharacterized protein